MQSNLRHPDVDYFFHLPRKDFQTHATFVSEDHDVGRDENDESESDDDSFMRAAKDEFEVKWQSQKYFEYFDELTKPVVAKALDADLELRDKVFDRLFDNDFRNFKQIRSLPAIAADLRARDKFMLGDGEAAVNEAIDWVSVVGLTKKALQVNDRILSFAKFLGSLTASDIDRIDLLTVSALREISDKVAEMADAIRAPKADD